MAHTSAFMTALLADRADDSAGADWLDRLRASALERANAVPMPSTRDEDWRFTDLAPLARLSFQSSADPGNLAAGVLQPLLMREAGIRVVLVDGMFVPALSDTSTDGGLRVVPLRRALALEPAQLEARMGRVVDPSTSVFAALNTAHMREATVISVDRGFAAESPVHVLHVATRRVQPQAVYPRILILAARGSRCSIVEDHVGVGEGAYFSAPVTEVFVDADATVLHARLQREGADAFQVGHCGVVQAQSSRYEAVNVALGARLSRLDLSVKHDGPGCETRIDGLALLGRRQLADMHSSVDHAYPQGRLRQVYKSVAGGGSHAVFNGKIIVREDAQQTDAAQSCRGLLLSDRARIDAKPQLEIFADDVKCAHGAAIGQLDPDETFYLQSRGLSAQRARNLLTYAFAAEVIERLPAASLRARLVQTVLERTQEGA